MGKKSTLHTCYYVIKVHNYFYGLWQKMLHHFKSPPSNEMMTFYFQIWFYKCYKLIKWVSFIIFNHIPTHIIPNLKVSPPPPQITFVTPKNGLSRVQFFVDQITIIKVKLYKDVSHFPCFVLYSNNFFVQLLCEPLCPIN
jgi:hypothetical protein